MTDHNEANDGRNEEKEDEQMPADGTQSDRHLILKVSFRFFIES